MQEILVEVTKLSAIERLSAASWCIKTFGEQSVNFMIPNKDCCVYFKFNDEKSANWFRLKWG